MARRAHLVITDSGLGGLAVCAGIERALRQGTPATGLRITYVNAWPEEVRGYNDLPDMAARAAAFDRALAAIDAMAPDQVLIACNTLSIVYEHTAHRRRAAIPVQGIVDAGVELFAAALRAQPASALVVIGTRTTIDSGAHARALRAAGLGEGRISGASCHGLATAIETAPQSAGTEALLDRCCAGAAAVAHPGVPLYVGLCCTHYGFVAPRIEAALSRHAARRVVALDPNTRLVDDVVSRLRDGGPGDSALAADLTVEMLSKVGVPEAKREGLGRILEGISAATACALRQCTHVPGLF